MTHSGGASISSPAKQSPDDRKHHTVPVCYLKAWQVGRGKNGLLSVERVSSGRVLMKFKTKPKSILYKKGFYDMSAELPPLPPIPSSLLETNVFAEAMENAFTKTLSKTLVIGKLPTVSQAAFIAEFCLTLYFRSPRFHRMIESYVDAQGWEERHSRIVEHSGARTLALTIGGSIEVVRNSVFQLHEPSGNERFWTSDTPCWMLYRDGIMWKPVSDFLDLSNRVRLGTTATRWVCPITPRWLMEICPCKEAGQRLTRRKATDDEVRLCNNLIFQVADEFRIVPPP